MRKINRIVVHCSATKRNATIGVREIDQWHKARGWSGIGYHEVINRDGELEYGRDAEKMGAHAKGYNKGSIGICLVGGLDDDMQPENNFTKEQMKMLRKRIDTWLEDFPDAEVLGHRDLPGVAKACPCFDVKGWFYASTVNEIRVDRPRRPVGFWGRLVSRLRYRGGEGAGEATGREGGIASHDQPSVG